MKTLAAYTPPTPPAPAMVAYINATLLDSGKVRITIRQQCDDTAKDQPREAHIDVEPERAMDFGAELASATSELADEMSYADLRASGGIVPADVMGEPVDTSDEACAVACVLVSNPQGSLRTDGDGWQKRVNDLIRALRDERNDLRRRLHIRGVPLLGS